MRMVMRIHDLPSGRLEKDFYEVNEAMFQGVDGQFEINFCILNI
jgi:hypothetical protein